MRRRTATLLVVALAALLAVAAAQSRPRASSTIDIGYVGDKSGPTVASQAPGIHAMAAYFKMVNDAGGVKGKKINLIERDDQYNPAIELQQVKQLVTDDKVPLVVGLGQSSGAASVIPVLAQNQTVGFFTQSNIREVTSPFQKWLFTGNCNLADQVDAAIGYELVRLHKKNLKGVKVGIAAIAVASGQEWTDLSKAAVERNGGTTVTESLPSAIVNADVQVQDLASEKVDFIMMHHAVAGGIAMLKSLAKYNVKVPVLGSYGVTNDAVFTQSPFEAAKNFYGMNCFTPPNIVKTAKGKQATAMGKKYGYPDNETSQLNWSLGWSQGQLITEALKKVKGDYTADNIRKALESVKNLDTGG
ncbi:MAG: branched-chain amino acid transport system substrate-binding protein, partial [Gaiellaceae bacterium]|nr:branched-chain amino acid transport system substrate-binding protein [Gaiellaceae bacterium]